MPKTLLLADDSVTIQKVVGISFANEDVVLLTVDNGDDAVTRAREARPDLVLADVVMPGLSGYEVCEAVKADPNLAGVPVLLLTGTFEAFDEARAQAAGADGHITKPFEAQALVDQVNALLARSATAPQAAATAPAASATNDDSLGLPAEGPAGSYEFFDDDTTTPGTPQPAASAAASSESLGLDDSGGQSFRFDTDTAPDLGAGIEPGSSAPPTTGGPGPDETQVLSAAPDPGDTTFHGFQAEVPAAPPEPEAEPVFDVLDPGADAGAAPAAATLDPDRAGAYDVSSTDLGTPAEAPAAQAPAPQAAPAHSPPPIPSNDETLVVSEPLVAAEPPPLPTAAPPPVPAPAPPAPVVAPAPVATPPPVAVEPPVAPARAIPEPVAAPFAAEPAAPEVPEMSPAMRDEIRATLEKAAWEAFGRITESVVQDAVERIEKVAWEVVPQLAETLVKEEIRRLRGDD